MQYEGKTDIGVVRQNNEDSYFMGKLPDSNRLLLIIADGMGGHNAGDIASSIAVDTIKRTAFANSKIPADDLLTLSVKAANKAVREAAFHDAAYADMGTTITAAVIDDHYVHIANVGDSRAYMHDGKGLRQITRDHSYVQELLNEGILTKQQAVNHPQRNYITRALGFDSNVKIDLYDVQWRLGDKLLLCTDGLTKHMSDEEISSVLTRLRTPRYVTETLINLVNSRGGTDNITVLAAFNDKGGLQG